MGLTDMKADGAVKTVAYAWIGIDERLPEEGGAYLVVYEHDYADGPIVTLSYFSNSEWLDSRNQIIMDNTESDGLVTHWMPLPPPPEYNAQA